MRNAIANACKYKEMGNVDAHLRQSRILKGRSLSCKRRRNSCRWEKVTTVRQAIESGRYDLDQALLNLARRVSGELDPSAGASVEIS